MRYPWCGVVALILLSLAAGVFGHGYLLVPPGRSSAWRYEDYKGYFRTNYNDNELFCGGFQNQFKGNESQCGVCGDDFRRPVPRANERGGFYAETGNIVEQYQSGGILDVAVKLTTNHRGTFVFDVCVEDDPKKRETEACFVTLDNAETGLPYTTLTEFKSGTFKVQLRIPETMTCKACVLRWKYITGNSWGCGPYSGIYRTICCPGCGGIQEHFFACSDIMITKSGKEKVPKWRRVDLSQTTINRPLPTIYPPPPQETTTRRPITTTRRTRRPIRTTRPTRRPFRTTRGPPQRGNAICNGLCRKYCKPGLDTFCLESLCGNCGINRRFVNRAFIED